MCCQSAPSQLGHPPRACSSPSTGSRVGQGYRLVQASSPAGKPASLPVLCLNTAAAHSASATGQEAPCSSLPWEASGTCQSCRVICPQSSASDAPSFQPMCHSSLCLLDHHFASGEKLQQHQLPRARMPRAGSTGSPYQLTGGCAGGCAPNRWWQKRSCSATCAVPLVPGHHGIFQSLEDKGTSLSQERAPAASPEAVPSSSPRVKGDPGGTQRDTGLLQPTQ